jgi:ribosomal peptide maturation radical SAM protein 1
VKKQVNGKRKPRPSLVAAIRSVLRDAEVLLIVPPIHVLKHPSLAAHLLQGCGREAGFRVQVLYANLILASVIGEEAYARLCDAPLGSFAGERLFARCAFGLPPLGYRTEGTFDPAWVVDSEGEWEVECNVSKDDSLTLGELKRLETGIPALVEDIAQAVSERSYPVVGCTTMFEQTAASVAFLKRIKQLNPKTTTLLGGANCEGEMAHGLASLGLDIDYIFSGESETTFPKVVRAVLAGSPPADRIMRGELCHHLDPLPTPRFSEFYEQRRRFLPLSSRPPEDTELLYESSRGCWWGQKHHCTFCGLNGEGMSHRQKSPDRVVNELTELLKTHPTRRVMMADNIIPHEYFRTLLPRLEREVPGLSGFYETKANLSLAHVVALKKAGITGIQPGIEALSSGLLRMMRKGVLARQNLMLLRFARAADVRLKWYLLWGFPGDEAALYEEALAIVRRIRHLHPPLGLAHLSIDRFSPYFQEPQKYGVKNKRPLAGYRGWLPKTAEVERIAYHFTGDYRCGSHKDFDVIVELDKEVTQWRAVWKQPDPSLRPELRITREAGGYVLLDTREPTGRRKRARFLDETRASFLLTSKPYSESAPEVRAVAENLAVVVDGWFVPLAVADPDVLVELTQGENRVERRPHESPQGVDAPSLVQLQA